MTVDKFFRWEWKELADKSCLYVTALGMVDARRWIAFFEEDEGTFPDGEAYIIVDNRNVEEKIDLEGFKGIIDIFKGQRIESAIFAVITTDQLLDITATMFQTLAKMSDFELQIKVFLSEGSARDWMVERIGRD